MMRDGFYCIPLWSGKLANLYWHLRNVRAYDLSKRRRYYRYVSVERKRLVELGHDSELVRLLARYLSNTKNIHAEERCRQYEETGRIISSIKAKAFIVQRAHRESLEIYEYGNI